MDDDDHLFAARANAAVDPRESWGAASLATRRGAGGGNMHVVITRYAGAAGKIGEAAPKVQQGFVPVLKGQPGLRGYAAFASEQGDIVACTIWESAEAAANSRDDVRGWVRRNLPGFMEPTE